MNRILLALAFSSAVLPAHASRATIGGPRHVDGTEITCDLPPDQMLHNTGGSDGPGGPGTGSGLCVFTSLDHSARWQNCEALIGFRDFMTHQPGGGYPSKVDRMISLMARSKGRPAPGYVQHTGGDPALLDLAIKTGRMPAVTYGYSERYGRPVAHMVNLIHLDGRLACVLDNNFPGADKLEWMERDEFLRRWRMMGGGWCVVLLAPAPPPIPVASPDRSQLAPRVDGPLAERADYRVVHSLRELTPPLPERADYGFS